MSIDEIILAIVVVLEAAIAVTLIRTQLHRRFPFFAAYIVCAAGKAIARSAAGSRGIAYFHVFWITETISSTLGLLAFYEAFKDIFRPLSTVWWLRMLRPVLWLGPLVIAVGNVVRRPPAEFGLLGFLLVLAFANAVCYVQAGFSALSFIVIGFHRVPAKRYSAAIIAGFGIAALGSLAAILVREDLRPNPFSIFLPWAAYIVALLVWLICLWGAEDGNGSLPSPDIPS